MIYEAEVALNPFREAVVQQVARAMGSSFRRQPVATRGINVVLAGGSLGNYRGL